MATWLFYACADMLLFGAAAVLAKAGAEKNNSHIAAALWGTLIFIFSCILIRYMGSGQALAGIGQRSWLFLALAGIATGISWLCLFRSLRTGAVIKIVPVYLANQVLSMLLRMLLFHTKYGLNQMIALVLIIVATAFIALHSEHNRRSGGYVWLAFALLSAFFASVATILCEYGVSGVNSYIERAVCACIAMVIAWIAAFLMGGGKGFRAMTFLDGVLICLSGAGIGLSWICYRRALAYGTDHIVVLMDSLAVLVVIALGCVFLRERLCVRGTVGVFLLALGIWLMLLETPILSLL